MPKKVQKTLQDYLSKVKSPSHPHIHLSRFLSACKHPKTHSFAVDDGRANRKNHQPSPYGGGGDSNRNNNHKDDAATLADIDRFLYENFKSLYLKDEDGTEEHNGNTKRALEEAQNELGPKSGPIVFDSPTSSISTTDSSSNNSREILAQRHNHALPDNCIALLKTTPSPYDDFRRSMQEMMVEARSGNRERVINWDFMQEILFSYLNLNEKKWHKYILSAFVDVIAATRRDLDEAAAVAAAPAVPRSVRTVRIGREVTKKTREVTFEFGSSD